MKKMNPYFSIVIVNFNTGKYLEEALLSVINQSCDDWELILVDGGSKDNSLDVIIKYSNYFSWWISEPDKGQSDAFNKGFAHARGKYYTWVNADDLLLPGTLEDVKKYFDTHPCCNWIALNTIYFDSKGQIISCAKGVSHSNFVLKHGVLTEVAPSTFFSSELYSNSNRFNMSCHYAMDTELWIQFVNNGSKYRRISKFGWGFRMHSDSKTAESIMQNRSNQLQLREYYDMLKKNSVQQYWIILLWQKFLRAIYSKPISFFYTLLYKKKNIKNMS